jgi:hypothetical protein
MRVFGSAKRLPFLLVILLVPSSAAVAAQGQVHGKPSVYITPSDDGFEVYVAAAIMKKDVPVTVLSKPENATYTLKGSSVDVQKETGTSKVMRCLFAYCAGIEDKASTSVQLIDSDGAIVWSYAVNKGRGAKNRQSMAEAIAKHLRSDFFHK